MTPSEQVTTLLKQFGLTTAAEELVPRLDAGRPPRRAAGAGGSVRGRSRGASPAPDCPAAAGLASASRQDVRDARPRQVAEPARAAVEDAGWRGPFLETATNVLAFRSARRGKEPRVVRRRTRAGPRPATACCACRPTPWCRNCSPPNATSTSRGALRKLDLFEVILLDDLGYVAAELRRSRGPVHVAGRALRAALGDGDQQPGLQPVGPDLFATRWLQPQRSTAWYTTRWCLSSTYRAIERTRRGQRHHRQHVVDGHPVRCCRGAADPLLPESCV